MPQIALGSSSGLHASWAVAISQQSIQKQEVTAASDMKSPTHKHTMSCMHVHVCMYHNFGIASYIIHDMQPTVSYNIHTCTFVPIVYGVGYLIPCAETT